ncbi:glycosyltransferase family 4 protein [Streptomyces sp. NPDC005134]|uniref:glycosyltransferase family 4 protein n=1 Tax=Streptomyces sp. NPDC005098 TaxID=3154560 RepID=UPI0033BB2A39
MRVIEEASVVVATVPAVFASVEESAAARQAVIFDWTDLWSSAASTFEGQGMASFGARTQAARWRKRERTLSRAPVARTFAGFADAETLLGVRGGDSWLPTPVTGHTRCAPQPEMAGGRRLGFIANLHYAPNRISLDKFLGDFGARLSGIGSRLVVAGPGSAEVDDPFGVVEPLGVVRRVEDFYQSIDAAVVPVEVGGGIKVKAIEALAHGVPVYGTRHVAEGFPPSLRPHISSLETLFDATHVPSMMPSEVWSSYFSVSAFNAGVARAVSVAGAARREVD